MNRIGIGLMLLVVTSSGVACRMDRRDSRDLVVRATTQRNRSDDRPERRVEVTVRDPSGASGPMGALTGRACRVQFRRDALGLASSTPVPATSDWQARLSMAGKISSLSDHWLVLSVGEKTYSIPVSAILMIELTD